MLHVGDEVRAAGDRHGIVAVLGQRGVAEDRIHDELFFAGPVDPATIEPPPAEDEAGTVALTFSLDGRASRVRMRPETSVLDAALAVRPELPFSCKGGMCASCKARVIEGSVEMDKNFALVQEDLAAGFVQRPGKQRLVVDACERGGLAAVPV